MTFGSGKTRDFLDDSGWADAVAERMSGDLSSRSYHRLRRPTGASAILSQDPSPKSAQAFQEIGDWLRSIGLSAPNILSARPESGLLLLEDFGDMKLTAMMLHAPERRLELYEIAIDVLRTIKVQPPLPLPQPTADELVAATQLVDDWYPNAQTDALNAIRDVLAKNLRVLCAQPPSVSLRDFHTDNTMWLGNRHGVLRLGLLDYQDAFLTHPAYDVMSMLTDARIDVPQELADAVLLRCAQVDGTPIDELSHAVAVLGVQRNLRILGIFVRAARRDQKPYHLPAVPRVRGHLGRCMSHPAFASVAHLFEAAVPEWKGLIE